MLGEEAAEDLFEGGFAGGVEEVFLGLVEEHAEEFVDVTLFVGGEGLAGHVFDGVEEGGGVEAWHLVFDEVREEVFCLVEDVVF